MKRMVLIALVAGNLANNSFAYYQSQQGRWLSRDRIGEQGGLNVYSYTRNAPICLIDKLGNAYGNPVRGPSGPVGSAYPYDRNPWEALPPSPPRPPAPGLGDQFNPFGCRGRTGTANYRTWFSQRFPNTITGSKKEIGERISKKACSDIKSKPTSIPDLTGPLDDIDIRPDMVRFDDQSQNWWETHVQIGFFEIKAENVQLNWINDCCFFYTATMFVQEHTGADAPWVPGGQCDGEDILWLTSMFWSRDVRMAEWNISGGKCCD